MPSFPFYQAPARAFYSADLYRDVAQRWRGIAMGYLLALLALLWLPTALSLRSEMRVLRQDLAPPIIRQVPRIVIDNGNAIVSGDTPLTIFGSDGVALALIDPDAGPGVLANSSAEVLLSRVRLYVRQGTPLDLDVLNGLVIDRAFLTELVDTLSRLVTWLAYPVGLLWSFSYRLVQALLFAVLGLIVANTLRVGLPYAALVRLSVVALTPVIVLRTVQLLLGFTIPLWWLVAFASFLAYLYFGLQAVRDTPATPLAAEPGGDGP